MKLMIVDDNVEMRRLIRSITGDLATSTIECVDGFDAVEAYAEHRPDLVFMDIQMAGLDGINATGAIRLAFPDARIVIVTEYNDPIWREEARRAGAFSYVLKENLTELRRIMEDQTHVSDT